MGKRSWSLVLSLALIAGVFTALPAQAQTALEVPETVQIDDPKGDANGLNDQDNAYNVPPLVGEGDHVGPADVGTATDIMKVWFSNTSTDVSLNIQLEGNPSLLAYDTYFRFSSNVGEGPVAADTLRGCLQWIASINGAAGAYNGPTEGNLTDKCNVGEPVLGPLTISEGPDSTFVVTVTFPRSYSPLLAGATKLTAPFGVSRVLYADGLPVTPANGKTAAFVTMDNTKRGSDYTFAVDGVVTQSPNEKPVPPGKNDPPGKGKKKGCGKGKGKQKGACRGGKPGKPPVATGCSAYVPGDEGKEAKTTLVTDAATVEKPVEVDLTAGAGGGAMPIGGTPVPYDETSSIYQNIQVDTADPSAGLYVRFEFPDRHDYDLYLNYPDGSTAANSGDANAAPGEDLGGGSPDGAWEAGSNYEQVMGIRTADCAGYTARMVSYLTNGGAVKLKVWLGEITADPVAPDGAQALTNFFGLTGLVNPSAPL